MKKIFLILLLLFTIVSCELKKAQEAYDNKEYIRSIYLTLSYFEKHPNKVEKIKPDIKNEIMEKFSNIVNYYKTEAGSSNLEERQDGYEGLYKIYALFDVYSQSSNFTDFLSKYDGDELLGEIYKIIDERIKTGELEGKYSRDIISILDEYYRNMIGYTKELSEIKKIDENKILKYESISRKISQAEADKLMEYASIKEKAEVFTPLWICNEQNNLIDELWFGKKNVFNFSKNGSWTVNKEQITFPKGKIWKDYVDAKRLEITCGEAPYIVSRYDTILGNIIPFEERIGLLDRKIRIINENTETEEEWFIWIKRAFESIYGYEYQGDNLLIARQNIFYTFIESMEYKFSHKPNEKQMREIAEIISWNIWQMDGITMAVPYSEKSTENNQLTLFNFINKNEKTKQKLIPCKIFDWKSKSAIEFKNINKRRIQNE